SAMKKSTTDAKKAAANDKPEVENSKLRKAAPKAKAEKPVERYTIGNIATGRGGFDKELCDFTAKKGTVDAEIFGRGLAGGKLMGRGTTAPGWTDTFGMR